MTREQPGTLIGAGLLGQDRFIELPDGRRLRLMIAGTGDDLVVLESGLGASGLYWGMVHRLIARQARVVTYERAGFGASSPASLQSRDLAGLATDLDAVATAIPHARLVLVGHSWGGPIVRTLAERRIHHGQAVDGIVLVDQSDENAHDLYNSAAARFTTAATAAVLVPTARVKILPLLLKTQMAGLPEPLRGAAVAASTSVQAARATIAENAHTGAELRRLHESPLALGRTGMSVISGQRTTALDRRLSARLLQAHRMTASQHPGARFVPASKSGHMVPITQPELIAQEALSFLN